MAPKIQSRAESTRIEKSLTSTKGDGVNIRMQFPNRRPRTTIQMVQKALIDMNAHQRKGITLFAIRKYVYESYNVEIKGMRRTITNKYLHELMSDGHMVNVTGRGLNGHFRLNRSFSLSDAGSATTSASTSAVRANSVPAVAATTAATSSSSTATASSAEAAPSSPEVSPVLAAPRELPKIVHDTPRSSINLLPSEGYDFLNTPNANTDVTDPLADVPDEVIRRPGPEKRMSGIGKRRNAGIRRAFNA